MSRCICKIQTEKITGTGFFCKISVNNKFIPLLITNYHILDDNYIETQKQLKIVLNDLNDNQECKIINIDKDSKLYSSTQEEYDLMVLRLKPNKEISNYLEIDNNIYKENSEILYENESIYILHFPNGEMSAVSFGKGFKKISNYEYKHFCNTELGSSGSPILNLATNKLIGIHRGAIKGTNNRFNIGAFLKDPLITLNKILSNSTFNSGDYIINYNTINTDKKEINIIKKKLSLNSLIPNKNICINHNETKNNINNIYNNKIKKKTPDNEINKDFINKDKNRNRNFVNNNQNSLNKNIKIKINNFEINKSNTPQNSVIKQMNNSPISKAYSIKKNGNITRFQPTRRCFTPNKNGHIKTFDKNFAIKNRNNQINNKNDKLDSKIILPRKKYDRNENYYKEKNILYILYQNNNCPKDINNLNKVKLNNNSIFNKSFSPGHASFDNLTSNNNEDKKIKIFFEKDKDNRLDITFKKLKFNKYNSKENNFEFSMTNVDNSRNNTNEPINPYFSNLIELLKNSPKTNNNKDIKSYYYINPTVQCLLNVEQLTNFFLSIKEEKINKKIPGQLSKLFYSIIDNLYQNKLNRYNYTINLIYKSYPHNKNENDIKDLVEFFIGTLHKELNKVRSNDEDFKYCHGQNTCCRNLMTIFFRINF